MSLTRPRLSTRRRLSDSRVDQEHETLSRHPERIPNSDLEQETIPTPIPAASPPPGAHAPNSPAPLPPDEREKRLYLRRYPWLLLPLSVVSFCCAMWSASQFLLAEPDARWLIPYLGFTVVYFLISLVVNLHRGAFRLDDHQALVARYAEPARMAGVDVLLPTSGEDLSVLANTWNGVRALCAIHEGPVTVYALDDSGRDEVRILAEHFHFHYSSRPDRGWYKKAGNLRHGYSLSRPLGHQFVVIFDADFRPRADFLRELLPYFYADPNLGLVQSPQYFDVRHEQTWLQRGAGAVQEFFYRFSQVARDSHDAAICVGTNAIYRRAALDDTGGTALIEHSEDVHTGFNLRLAGWDLRYVPLILAKGVCPDSLEAFFKQQYRWCLGSMSLLASRKFWRAPLRLRQRLCYLTGFCYYIHTAIALFVAPIIPLLLLTVDTSDVSARNYLLLTPVLLYTFVVFPLWHRTDYGSDAWAVKNAYSWAHLMALVDSLRHRPMGWTPTGAKMAAGSGARARYRTMRVSQALVSFLPSLAWVALAFYHVATLRQVAFVPLLVSGAFAAYATGRVALYRERPHSSHRYHLATGDPTYAMPVVPVMPALGVPPSHDWSVMASLQLPVVDPLPAMSLDEPEEVDDGQD